MADIGITNCTIHKNLTGEFADVMIITPDTADSNDTVDISTLVNDGQVLSISGWDVETGDSVTATYATGTGLITVDASGGTTNHTYAINIKYVGYSFTP